MSGPGKPPPGPIKANDRKWRKGEPLHRNLTSAGLMKTDAIHLLTECEPDGYPDTVLWAQSVHHDNPALAGLFWVSRRYNEGRAMVLFGDRIAKGALQVQHGPIPLRYFETEIDDIAARCDIDIIRR